MDLDKAADRERLELMRMFVQLDQLCDKQMNDGTPWWVFRDAVREILHPSKDS